MRFNGKTLKIEFVGTCSATPVVAPLCQTNLMGRPNDVHLSLCKYLMVALVEHLFQLGEQKKELSRINIK
ncbi:hypothetical protein GLYMA_14G168000v4 [Glycine max]|uniref:Uncharacterized protein n=1 Tax=Glycine max TaxID=3847 RepID=K7M7I2_SOYBN|nr:hypothetical protein GYH30_040301 [Glycine max]KRH16648.1 hypothetical protein GLYMA_14G168000v4 [Glycine max]